MLAACTARVHTERINGSRQCQRKRAGCSSESGIRMAEACVRARAARPCIMPVCESRDVPNVSSSPIFADVTFPRIEWAIAEVLQCGANAIWPRRANPMRAPSFTQHKIVHFSVSRHQSNMPESIRPILLTGSSI